MNRNELNELIGKTQPNICQIVVLKDGREVYANEWNGYKRDDCTHIMSATKSIVSLLTGIATGRGLIKSIDDRVLDYFPDYQVKHGEKTAQRSAKPPTSAVPDDEVNRNPFRTRPYRPAP